MILYFSATVGRCDPERFLKNCAIMLTYQKANESAQKRRFVDLLRARKVKRVRK